MLRVIGLFSQPDSRNKPTLEDKLPNEMWKNIFDHLSAEEKIAAMYVCKNWFNFLYHYYEKDIQKAVKRYHNPKNSYKEYDNNMIVRAKRHPQCYPIRFIDVLKDTFIVTPIVTSFFNLFSSIILMPDFIKEKSSLRNYIILFMLQGSMWGTIIFCTGVEKYLEHRFHNKKFMDGEKASLRLGVMNQIKIYLDSLPFTTSPALAFEQKSCFEDLPIIRHERTTKP